jgi:hypothetical protein
MVAKNGSTWNPLRLFVLMVAAVPCLGAECEAETRFSASFESNTQGAPPDPVQPTGRVRVESGAGSVLVVPTPAGGDPDKWVRIRHPVANTNPTAMIADLSRSAGNGTTTLIATLFIPPPGPRPNPGLARALATVQFETTLPDGQAPSFMHLDFMDTGEVRIDDLPSTTFGSFPFGEPFTISVGSEVTPSNATAHITLLSPASGQVDRPIGSANLARAFSAVRFWIGFQFAATFFIDDLTVLHVPPS